MQLISKLGKIFELKATLCNENSTNNTLVDFYKKFQIKRIKTFFDGLKTKGFSSNDLLFSLLLTRILKVTVSAYTSSNQSAKNQKESKDTLYRLKNNCKINWRKLLFYFISRYIILTERNTDIVTQKPKCMIIDDTTLFKTGKYIEFVSMVKDHTDGLYKLGYKMLALGYYDGVSTNMVDFSYHRECRKKSYGLKKKDLEKQYSKEREKNSAGYKRVQELDKSKIDVAIQMVKRAAKHGLSASYLLFDSWFMSEKTIVEVRKIKQGSIHILGMCRMDGRKYTYNDKELTAKQILKICNNKKQVKRCRSLKSKYIRLTVYYKGMKVQLLFSKYRNQKGWRLVVTTDLTLSYIKAMEIYQIRWSIEVFFKEAKQYLQLGKSQSNDFDAQIADTTITAIVYLLLNLRRRFSAYDTIGGVFRDEHRTHVELTLWERIWGVFMEIISLFTELFDVDVDEILEKIVAEKAGYEKLIFLLENFEEKDKISKTA